MSVFQFSFYIRSGRCSKTWIERPNLCILYNNGDGGKFVVDSKMIPKGYFTDTYEGAAQFRTRYITGDMSQVAGVDVKYMSATSVKVKAINSYSSTNYGVLLYGIL